MFENVFMTSCMHACVWIYYNFPSEVEKKKVINPPTKNREHIKLNKDIICKQKSSGVSKFERKNIL